MRFLAAITLLLALGRGSDTTTGPALPVAAPNANEHPAGTLRSGVLALALVAANATWHPDGDSLPGRSVLAFAEEGGGPLVPGPLVRVVAGTAIHLGIRNATERDTLTFRVPAALRGRGAAATDSVIIPPGERRELRVAAVTPGTYWYSARGGDALSRTLGVKGMLSGALIVDSAGDTRPRRDRVFVLTDLVDAVDSAGIPVTNRTIFAINGRSWPHTERIPATVGDTLRWRLVNTTSEVHPMHLHGFYYRVEESIDQTGADRGANGRMVVTERMPSFSSMTTTWVPERAGNWLFHCHFQVHVATVAAPASARSGHDPMARHAETGMRGLVMGVVVRPRDSRPPAAEEVARRRVRVLVVRDSAGTDSFPSMRYIIEDPAASARAGDAGPGITPPLVLRRGEPVAITVVNRLSEPTSVHWHGIELESYYDGVAGFSGSATRLSPLIAPRDSFVARFTPPRAGTFMYHSHVDEPRTHRAGLVGALLVREPDDPGADDHAFLVKAAQSGRAGAVVDINGRQVPDTVVLHAGRPARFRLANLTRNNPNATFWLTARVDSARVLSRDTLVVPWRPLAKDGYDLPAAARTPRLARQVVSMGETYDFEFTPATRGVLRLEVRAAGAQRGLLNRVPIRVE